MHNKGTVSGIHSYSFNQIIQFSVVPPVSGKDFRGRRIRGKGGGAFIFVDSGLLLVILMVGAWYDVREQRIPNWWCALACIFGLFLTWRRAPGEERIWPLALYGVRLLTVTAVWFPLFRLRMIGAGDVKLMAIIVGFLGFKTGAIVIWYGFFIGAVLALLKMLVCRNLRRRLTFFFAYIRRLFLTKEPVPYYQASRDGKNAVIPMALCLLGGYVWHVIKMWMG